MIKEIQTAFEDGNALIKEFLSSDTNIKKIDNLSEKIAKCFKNGNKVLICGNGGSACDSMHFAEEFTGRYRKNRPALPVISLTDSSHITCVGNDFGFDQIFSRGVEAYGKPGDIFIGLSTSGNSNNVINAQLKAVEMGLSSVLLLGKDGGALKGIGDTQWIIPGNTADRIQEMHMMILHILIECVERRLFPNLY